MTAVRSSATSTGWRPKLFRLSEQDWVVRDWRRRIFGSGEQFGHRHKRRAPLSEQALAELEQSFGIELPSELRSFLQLVHSGGAGPGYGFHVESDAKPLPQRARPFLFDTSVARDLIQQRLAGGEGRWGSATGPDEEEDDEADEWPPGPGFVPIAHMGCGVFDVLVTVGEQRGFVWSVDNYSWCPAFDAKGRQLGFLDWYEQWLDQSLPETGVKTWSLLQRLAVKSS